MKDQFFSGKKICEELGILPSDLARACDAGNLQGFRKDGVPILASSQCEKKFKYPHNTIFSISVPDFPGIIAINKESISDFNISSHVSVNKNYSKTIYDINYRNRTYIPYFNMKYLYLRYKDIQKLKNFLVYNKDFSSINFDINDNIFFQVKKEGIFNIDFLILYNNNLEQPEYENLIIENRHTTIQTEKISDCRDEKIVIKNYDNNYVSIGVNNPFYIREDYSYQYYADFYKKDDYGLERSLHFYDDYFIFDFNDFYKHNCQKLTEHEIRTQFIRYIENLLFNIGNVKKFFYNDIEIIDIKRDPREYLAKKCRSILNKYIDDDKKLNIIRAYYTAISLPKKTWKEIHEKFWLEHKLDEQTDSFINKQLESFKKIAKEEGIPYIPAGKLKSMTKDTSSTIADEMIKQLEDMKKEK